MNPVLYDSFCSVVLTVLSMYGCNERPDMNKNTARIVESAIQVFDHSDSASHQGRDRVLESIFTHLHGENKVSYAVQDLDGCFAGFGDRSNVDWQGQILRWKGKLQDIQKTPEYANALLETVEDCFSDLGHAPVDHRIAEK